MHRRQEFDFLVYLSRKAVEKSAELDDLDDLVVYVAQDCTGEWNQVQSAQLLFWEGVALDFAAWLWRSVFFHTIIWSSVWVKGRERRSIQLCASNFFG